MLFKVRAGRPRDRGSVPDRGKIILFSTKSRPALAHAAFYSMGTGSSSSGVKRPGLETGYSPSCTAEDKNGWRYTSIPPSSFITLCLVKRRDFTLLFYIYHVRQRDSEIFFRINIEGYTSSVSNATQLTCDHKFLKHVCVTSESRVSLDTKINAPDVNHFTCHQAR
jgi:hypothetical protein